MSQYRPDPGSSTPHVPRLRDRDLGQPLPIYPPRERPTRKQRNLGPLWIQALAMYGALSIVVTLVVFYEVIL